MEAAKRFWAIFDKTITILMGLAAALVVLDALAVTFDVLLRYSLGITHVQLFEIVEYTLLWVTFLGTAWLMKNDGHVRVDLVVKRFPPGQEVILKTAASILGVMLLGFVTWYSAKVTLQDLQTGFTLSGVLRPPKWPIEIIIPIGFFLLLIQSARNTYGHLMSWRASSRGQQMSSDSSSGGEV